MPVTRRFSAFQYNTTVKHRYAHILHDGGFSAFQYNTTVKRANYYC